MAKFSFFKPWTWFQSEERKEIRQKITNIEETVGNLQETVNSLIPTVGKPYINIFFSSGSVTVIAESGNIYMKSGVDKSIVEEIKSCNTEKEIRTLLSVPEESTEEPPKEEELTETVQERNIVSDNLTVLRYNPDFRIVGTQVFLQEVNLELPAVVVGSFIELLERLESTEDDEDPDYNYIEQLQTQFQALKMFWYWTALNPIESARKDLFNFIRRNDVTITSNGLLMMYRRILAVDNDKVDKNLIQFVSKMYAKVKKHKKSPKNYHVWADGNGKYTLHKGSKAKKKSDGIGHSEGNLYKLYQSLSEIQTERAYTDNYTRKKDIKIGAIYREDESKIDLDNHKDCSGGLHVGSKSFGFDGFGNVGVLCLVNPMYVRSVPVSATNKMRVSEMFVVGEMDIKDYSDSVDNQDVVDYSEEYCNTTLEVLKESLKNKSFDNISCQGNKPVVQIAELPDILQHIEERVSLVY